MNRKLKKSTKLPRNMSEFIVTCVLLTAICCGAADYVTEYTNRIYNQLAVAANNTEGALTCYIRYNPDFTDPTSGKPYQRD